jgi:hypothetical protein
VPPVNISVVATLLPRRLRQNCRPFAHTSTLVSAASLSRPYLAWIRFTRSLRPFMEASSISLKFPHLSRMSRTLILRFKVTFRATFGDFAIFIRIISHNYLTVKHYSDIRLKGMNDYSIIQWVRAVLFRIRRIQLKVALLHGG